MQGNAYPIESSAFGRGPYGYSCHGTKIIRHANLLQSLGAKFAQERPVQRRLYSDAAAWQKLENA